MSCQACIFSGFTLGAAQSATAVTNKHWQCHVGSFLACHLQQLLHRFEAFNHFQNDNRRNLLLHWTLQPEYEYAQYLSESECLSIGDRGAGLVVVALVCVLTQDGGRSVFTLERQALSSVQVNINMEDKLHLLFDCPLYSSLGIIGCILYVADFAVAERERNLCTDGRVVSASIPVTGSTHSDPQTDRPKHPRCTNAMNI